MYAERVKGPGHTFMGHREMILQFCLHIAFINPPTPSQTFSKSQMNHLFHFILYFKQPPLASHLRLNSLFLILMSIGQDQSNDKKTDRLGWDGGGYSREKKTGKLRQAVLLPSSGLPTAALRLQSVFVHKYINLTDTRTIGLHSITVNLIWGETSNYSSACEELFVHRMLK